MNSACSVDSSAGKEYRSLSPTKSMKKEFKSVCSVQPFEIFSRKTKVLLSNYSSCIFHSNEKDLQLEDTIEIETAKTKRSNET